MLNLPCFFLIADDKDFFSQCMVSFAVKLGSFGSKKGITLMKHN